MDIEKLAERCMVAESCLPDAPYRTQLCKLHQEMLDEIARLRAEVDSLTMELATAVQNGEALRVDSERLDWLDTQRSDMVQQGPCGEPELYGHEWGVCAQEYNVRAAIDAARGQK